MSDTAGEETRVIEVPEAVGVFDSFGAQQAAFYDLRAVGFHHSDISLLGSREVMEERYGQLFWRSEDLADDPHAPRASFVSEEAIGELEGAIAGGFFFVGSYVAMAALLTPASVLAASVAAIAIGGGLLPSWARCWPVAWAGITGTTTPTRSSMAVS